VAVSGQNQDIPLPFMDRDLKYRDGSQPALLDVQHSLGRQLPEADAHARIPVPINGKRGKQGVWKPRGVFPLS
jgi:hypothetical protein